MKKQNREGGVRGDEKRNKREEKSAEWGRGRGSGGEAERSGKVCD